MIAKSTVMHSSPKQRGAVLIVSLIFLLVMTILILASMRGTVMQERMAGNLYDRSLAFQAADRAMVDAFHEAALAHGGIDNGVPAERPYHPGYYAAFVLDPDGNNIEAVFHGDARRSASSVKITF